MRVAIDTESKRLRVWDDKHSGPESMPLYSPKAFEVLTKVHQQVGWQLKQPYSYSWMGLPILQIPDDMIRMAEVVHRLKPDVIVEAGVAMGGSLVFYASLLSMNGYGRVIGIEKGLRCKEAIAAHPMNNHIHAIIEGDSTDPDVVAKVHRMISLKETVLVILDSDHSKAHVSAELEAYHDLIKPGFYIVATDGNRKDLATVTRGNPEWAWDNAEDAALEFVAKHPEFIIEQPAWPYNESGLSKNITYWPSAFIKRKE